MLRVLLAAFLLAVSFALESNALAQGAGSRPNIVFILTDDSGCGECGVILPECAAGGESIPKQQFEDNGTNKLPLKF